MLNSALSVDAPDVEDLTPSLISSSLEAIDGESVYSLLSSDTTFLSGVDEVDYINDPTGSFVDIQSTNVPSSPGSSLTSPSSDWQPPDLGYTASCSRVDSSGPWIINEAWDPDTRSISAPVTPEDPGDSLTRDLQSMFVGSHSWEPGCPLIPPQASASSNYLPDLVCLSSQPEPRTTAMVEHQDDSALGTLDNIPVTVFDIMNDAKPLPVHKSENPGNIPVTVNQPPPQDVKSHIRERIIKRRVSYPAIVISTRDTGRSGRFRTKSEGDKMATNMSYELATPSSPKSNSTAPSILRAGFKWRQKKKEEFLLLNREFTTRLSQNTHLKYQVAQLQKELQQLNKLFTNHLVTCKRPRDSASVRLSPDV